MGMYEEHREQNISVEEFFVVQIVHRRTDDSLHDSLEGESSATALLHDSSRATQMTP